MVARIIRWLAGTSGAARPGVLVSGGVAASAVVVAIALSADTGGGGGTGACDLNATTANFAAQVAATPLGKTLCIASGSYGTWTPAAGRAITIKAASGATATMALDWWSGTTGYTLDGLRITDGQIYGSTTTARNLTIQNSTFTGPLIIDGPSNANILLDHNVHDNIGCTTATARVWLRYSIAAPSGVTVQNSSFVGGSADGIQAGSAMTVLNNRFANITEGADQSCHTDALQLFCGCGTGVGTTIRGNWFTNNATAIAGYDGGNNHLIEHNVITGGDINNGIILGGDSNSIVQWNTCICAVGLNFTSKAGMQTTNVVVRNNVSSTGVTLSGGGCGCTATAAVNTNNLFSGAASPNINGSPTFTGGASPVTFTGFTLATGSAGRNAATDGTDVGAFGAGFSGGPP